MLYISAKNYRCSKYIWLEWRNNNISFWGVIFTIKWLYIRKKRIMISNFISISLKSLQLSSILFKYFLLDKFIYYALINRNFLWIPPGPPSIPWWLKKTIICTKMTTILRLTSFLVDFHWFLFKEELTDYTVFRVSYFHSGQTEWKKI